MIRHKWIIGVRNKLSDMYGECYSAAAINGAKMSDTEQEELRALIWKSIEYIDKKLHTFK